MWSPPPPSSPSWRLWILLHIWMKEMFAWSRAKPPDPSASASWTWTPTRYRNRLHLVMLFNVHADSVAFLLEYLCLFSTASEAFGWASHQAQPALCWWSSSLRWNCQTPQEPKVSGRSRFLLAAALRLEVLFTTNLLILSVRRDLDKPNTSILGVPPDGSVIGVSSRNSVFGF